MSVLAQSILSAAHRLPEGGLLLPKEFLHLGSRASVDQTLTRLAREGGLLRVGRGMYVLPVQSRFGVRPPATQAVVLALEAAQGDVIVNSGATEAIALGLTTQVPVREVLLTSGPSRTLQLGSRTVELQHAKRWLLVLGKRPAGQAIRALSWLGPEHGSGALKRLQTQLATEEWTAIRSVRSMLPSWMARAIGEAGECG